MQDLQIDSKNGIMYRTWKAGSAEAVVLLVHGMGAHSARWDFLGDFLMERGISSYALELKGFGGTEGLKGHIDSLDIYYRDIVALRNLAISENPGKKVYLIGESMGALLLFSLIQKEKDVSGGLICISPAFMSKIKMSIMEYIKIFSSAIYFPRKQFSMPFTADMCTRDKEYCKVMDEDEREHRYATSGLLSSLAGLQICAGILKNHIEIPILFLIAGEDKLVDPEASKKVFRRLKANDKTIIEYPDMYHALSIEKDREKVFEDMFGWIEERS